MIGLFVGLDLKVYFYEWVSLYLITDTHDTLNFIKYNAYSFRPEKKWFLESRFRN